MMITCNAQFGRPANATVTRSTSAKRLSPVRRRGVRLAGQFPVRMWWR